MKVEPKVLEIKRRRLIISVALPRSLDRRVENMKDQRLSLKVVSGIVFIAVLMLSSTVWADTILLQFPPPGSPPPGSFFGMTVTVAPGADPSQVLAIRNGIGEAQINGNAAWAAAGKPEI